ncbi:hypothetical protein U1Q18_041911 [Sarracenia purpurea var. burkii]
MLKAQAIAVARPMLKTQVKANNNACEVYQYQDIPRHISRPMPSVQAKGDDNAEVNELLRPSKSSVALLLNKHQLLELQCYPQIEGTRHVQLLKLKLCTEGAYRFNS